MENPKWTAERDAHLQVLVAGGADIDALIAAFDDFSPGSVRARVNVLGLFVYDAVDKVPDQHVGNIEGDARFQTAMNAAIAAGLEDPHSSNRKGREHG